MQDLRSLEQVGPYRVLRFVEEGAFAWVFEVVDPKFAGRRLALKMLKPDAAAGAEFRRFEKEAEMLAGIDHPNIVTIFDFGRDQESGCFYYTMTFVDGPTLKERLLEGPLSIEEAVGIFADLLDGLASLHDRGIVHRDIKPANVLLGRDGRARLSDLGIARVQTERSHTRTGVAVGTALYMSPEQARGRPVDARSDIFSAGLTLYEAVTGHVVYDHVDSVDSSSGMDVLIYIGSLDQQKDAEFRIHFPKSIGVPKTVQHIVAKSCHLRAEHRYQDARSMRDDLREALLAPMPEPARALDTRWLAIGGGALAAIVAAVAFYFGYWVPREQRIETTAVFDATSQFEERARGIVTTALALEPPPPRDVVSDVNELFGKGEDYRFDSAEDLESRAFPAAVANLARARQRYESACQRLGEGFLQGRADDVAARATEQRARLSDVGAPEIAPDAWARLEAVAPRLAGPESAPSGCAGAEAQLARVQAGDEARQLAADLESELAETWPRVAEAMQRDALAARARATAESVAASEHREAVLLGKRALLIGEQRASRGDYKGARDAYAEALSEFETALAIVPAARARGEVTALSQKITADGTSLGGIVRLQSRANELYAEGNWEEATTLYGQVLEQLTGMRAQKEWLQAVAAARERATTVRENALTQGADQSAGETFAAADAARDEAEAAVQAQQFEQAEKQFNAARDQYAAAMDTALQAVREASLQRDQVLALAEDLSDADACQSLQSTAGRSECVRAAALLAEGEAALQAFDAPTAQTKLAEAAAAYQQMGAELAEWEKTRPRPPVLVRRIPISPDVEVRRNRLHSFTVEATDPNGDALRYRWSLDGQPLEGSDASLRLRAERSGVLEVRIDDGNQGELVETWNVAVQNRAPKLAVSPEGPDVTLRVGATQRFEAEASDPDGDTVETVFRIGGREVTDAAYEFRADSPGAFALEVVARDAGGAETRVSRRIQVSEAAAAPPPRTAAVLRAPPPKSEPSSPELDDALPQLDGWQGDVVAALRAYRRALEEGNIEGLQRVLVMSDDSPVRAFYTRKFQRGENVDVAIRMVGDIEGDAKRARVDFDQTESTPERTRTYRYRASMVRSDSGDWRIQRRERRP